MEFVLILIVLWLLHSNGIAYLMWQDYQRRHNEVNRLQTAIRKHRDQRLDDRCWMDDIELYEVLPEGADPKYIDLRLLSKEEMMRNCERFVTCRRTCETPEEAIQQYKNERVL